MKDNPTLIRGLQSLEGGPDISASHRTSVSPSEHQGFLNPLMTVLLVEDHAIMRAGLRALLETDRTLLVIGEAEDGRQAIQMARESRPEAVLMDIAMPCLNGLEATRQIVKELPATKIIILSCYSDDRCVQQALEAGAAGYLHKGTAVHELLSVLRMSRTRTGLFSQAITRTLQEKKQKGFFSREHSYKQPIILTPREREVLQLIAEGHANKQVAAELSISIKTVEKHRQAIMDKLSIHQTAGLTRYAISIGMIENRALPVSLCRSSQPPAA